jgi:hypothetical protein
MATGTSLITAALQEINAIAQGEAVPATDETFVLGKLNRLLDSWNLQQRYVFFVGHASYEFATSKQTYTIGPSGADFTAPRPVRILRANLILVNQTPDNHFPLTVINWARYADHSVPALASGIPIKLYYQETIPSGSLWPWPYPTVTTNKLELFTWNQLTAIASVGATYNLAPGYEDAIILSLAETLCSSYGKPLAPELAMNAQKARGAITGPNVLASPMNLSLVGDGDRDSYYDIRTGVFE